VGCDSRDNDEEDTPRLALILEWIANHAYICLAVSRNTLDISASDLANVFDHQGTKQGTVTVLTTTLQYLHVLALSDDGAEVYALLEAFTALINEKFPQLHMTSFRLVLFLRNRAHSQLETVLDVLQKDIIPFPSLRTEQNPEAIQGRCKKIFNNVHGSLYYIFGAIAGDEAASAQDDRVQRMFLPLEESNTDLTDGFRV